MKIISGWVAILLTSLDLFNNEPKMFLTEKLSEIAKRGGKQLGKTGAWFGGKTHHF